MIVVIAPQASTQEGILRLNQQLVALYASEHTWHVPNPQDWRSPKEFAAIPMFEEIFRKAATFTVASTRKWVFVSDTPPGPSLGLVGPWAVVRLDSAYAWLNDPISVVVEDAKNDGAFVRSVAAARGNRWIADATTRRIDYTHGGGSGLRAALERVLDVPYRRRVLVICDSDRQEKDGSVSAAIAPLELVCGTHPYGQVRLIVLSRREIENYLPLALIRRFVFQDTPRHGASFGRLKILATLWADEFSEEQRSHFDMKVGIHAKSTTVELGLLAGVLRLETEAALTGGFTKAVIHVWDDHGEHLTTQHLSAIGVITELDAMLAAIDDLR
jgi:hypothetical protein